MSSKPNRITGGTVAKAFAVMACLAAVLSLSDCKGEDNSPTGATFVPAGDGVGGNVPSTTNNPPPTSPDAVSEDPAPSKPSGRIFKPSKGKLSGRGTNDTGSPVTVALACYTPRGPAGTFIKGTFTNATVGVGQDYELDPVLEPLCDYQCDIWFDVKPGKRADDAEAGPEFNEQEFIDANFGGTAGASCKPPEPPCANPPCVPAECDREQLQIDAKRACGDLGVKSLDFENCTWKCNEKPTCEEEPARNRLINAAIRDCGSRELVESIDFVNCDWECKEDECDVGALEALAKQRKQRCENAGGTYKFVINEDECKLRDECIIPPPECVPPSEQSFSRDRSLGNEAAECLFFGDYEPGTPGDFFVTKCGLFYEVTHDPFQGDKCSNGQDVSHSTACVCIEDDD